MRIFSIPIIRTFLYAYRRSFILFFLLIIICSCHDTDHSNVELTTFSEDVVSLFIESNKDAPIEESTCFYNVVFKDSVMSLATFIDSSHEYFIGKTIVNGREVGLFGDDNSLFCRDMQKNNRIKKINYDYHFYDDRPSWTITISDDAISISGINYDKVRLTKFRHICKTYYPSKKVLWQRNSFRLDDIEL